MIEYALIHQGKIASFRAVKEPLDPAGIRKEGAAKYVELMSGKRVTIVDEALPKVIAPERVKVDFVIPPITVPVDAEGADPADIPVGDNTTPIRRVYIDGEYVGENIPFDLIVGRVVTEGGLPVLRPVEEIKPADFDPDTEVLVNAGEEVFDDRVVRTLLKQPKPPLKLTPQEKLLALLVSKGVITQQEAEEVQA